MNTGQAQHAPNAPQAEEAEPSVYSAMGGPRGLLDTGLPGIVFVMVFVLGGGLQPAVWAAVAVGAVLFLARLLRRETLQHALAGFVGVGIAAYIAHRTGRPENFFLPGLLINGGYLAAFAVSLLARWPLLGILLGPVFGEGLGWRRDPVRRRAYALASLVWVGMFVVRLGVLVPLYLTAQLVPLGVARVALGFPLYLLVLWMTFLILKQSKPVSPQQAA
ncbi:MAG: DUF3159 domain-containing protein [Streptosporangiales bacterium]|nr:DUF3159 domain-containing protein [Streptosporangiales bacterium]